MHGGFELLGAFLRTRTAGVSADVRSQLPKRVIDGLSVIDVC
jgi:hypothetical protein